MNMHRKGESGAVPFRSGRFFNIDSDWYFACREGRDNGPFLNREEARNALMTYLAKRTRAKDKTESSASLTAGH